MSSSAESPSAVSDSAPKGLEHPGVIDLFTHDRETGRITLIMVERRPWEGGEEQLFQLQEKLNAYLSFALDGELAEAYPALVGQPLQIRLECCDRPSPEAIQLLAIVREQIAFQGIDLEVLVTGDGRHAPR